MKKNFLLNTILIVCCFFVKAEDLKLWYKQPATQWVEALPLGNSRLGAMVYGIPAHEEIQLNEETVWGGGPHRNDNPEAQEALSEVRRLIFEGKSKEAKPIMEKKFRTPRNGMPYQTIGSLKLHFNGHENYTDYYRDLDLKKAVTTTRYKVNDVTYTRELFTSFADNIIIMRISSDKQNALNFTADYTSPLKHFVSTKKGKLILSGKGADHEGVTGVIRLENQTFIKTTDGKVEAANNKITVSNATTAIIYISAATNFVNYNDVSANEHKRADTYMKEALKKTYDKALSDHIAYYRNNLTE